MEPVVTIQQVCAFTAQPREKVIQEFKNPIAAGDIKWIFERNCESTEQLQPVYIKFTCLNGKDALYLERISGA